ncbi:hypothetical protein NTGBS_80020 [Candidatus Nitrotoga sp. BS]|uniref:hypothetical protein n=1 Tax=Candidatus Nitrotoga sp. BS TaxID=2890408 RepID=UPI001EF16591|nr:hypothetical protein [Candidatus Nitrotoga sp. BS]CAH1209346.1 hypothetical protein NTGBS_80020 [Candidatus Nitrotoga sp. BS]
MNDAMVLRRTRQCVFERAVDMLARAAEIMSALILCRDIQAAMSTEIFPWSIR